MSAIQQLLLGNAGVAAGGGGPKTIDGTAGGQFSGAGPGTITLSTTQTNDVAILVYFHENNATTNTIASVTSPHLTWAKRSSYFTLSTWDFEIWWAPAAAVLTSEVITITLTGPTDDAAYHAFGVNGCSNISAPWDTNASLATAHNTTSASSLTLSGISTSFANSMTIGVQGSAANVRFNNPAGTTKIRADQANSGGTLFACLGSYYQNNSSALSSASYTATLSTGSGN